MTHPLYQANLSHGSRNDNIAFVLKPVSRSIFEQSQELKQKFGNVRQIRHHVDEDEGNHVLIYDYAISNVLEMIHDCPPLPLQARKTILKEVGLALKEMHARNWIHLDRKRDVAEFRRTTGEGNGQAFGGIFFQASERRRDLEGYFEEDEERAQGYGPFEQWTETDYPNLNEDAKRLILRMTNLDPGKRAEMADIMADPYWDGVGSEGTFETEECFKDGAKLVV
ncbi:putative serine/threonine protein kinase [Sclerotinia borealis F-4128]|uniref:Putative serine/threonine protein kinase n=1 Tax=Sclerotinia borealis (strain F-4128) TaxID=1432307 RepID=W9CMC0_SCLBF|nr:putative serine/threonine protein kinase [Sclerotinia borealis F-4128]